MERVLRRYGGDPLQPTIFQVSRFDPWKAPLGVIAVFQPLQTRIPEIQLALLGNFAVDDPEGTRLYSEVRSVAQGLVDGHIITGLTDVVNPLQAIRKMGLQKSMREGFGLTVAEAL